MALFQKRPEISSAVPIYTLGQNKSVLIVGLGNIGREYDLTRHNVGFYALDHFASKMDSMSDWILKKDLHCHLSTGRVGDTRVIAIKPTTLMNHSGLAVQAVSNFYKIALTGTVVVHDELDITFGQIRLRTGGSAAGNNGIKSVSSSIGEEYGRIRIGIGPKMPEQMDAADFVLQKFNADQQAQLPNLATETTAILTEYLYSGQLPHDTRSFFV